MQRVEKEAWQKKVSEDEPDFGQRKGPMTKKMKAANFLKYADENETRPQGASSSSDLPPPTAKQKQNENR